MNIAITAAERRSVAQSLSSLIKRCEATKKTPSEVLYAEEGLGQAVFRSLFKIKDLNDNFDVETIAEFLDVTHEMEQSKPAGSTGPFLDAFLSMFEYAIDKWIAIVPLGFCGWPFGDKNQGKSVRNQYFSICRAQKNGKSFEQFANRRMTQKVKVREGLVEHQVRQTDKAIINYPLFLCELKGSCQAVRQKISYRHSIFMRLIRLYISKYDARVIGRPVDHSEVRHYLLLDTKTGQLERFPLRSSGDIGVIWSAKTFKEYQKAGFLFYYNFLVESKSKLRNRLLRSLEFFSRGVSDRDPTTRFVSLVISLEALFSRSPENPIKAYLAESAAVIEPSRDRRMQTYEVLRASYDTRSKIVHRGEFSVPYESAQELERVAASVIFNAMVLIRDVVRKSGDEDQFFVRILKLKLDLP